VHPHGASRWDPQTLAPGYLPALPGPAHTRLPTRASAMPTEAGPAPR